MRTFMRQGRLFLKNNGVIHFNAWYADFEIRLASLLITLKEKIMMKKRMVTLTHVPVYYKRRVGQYGIGNYQVMEEMKQWVADNLPDETDIWAIPLDNPNQVTPKECRYDVCATKLLGGIPLTLPRDIKHRTLLAGKYMVITIPHTVEGTQVFWQTFLEQLEEYDIDRSRPIMEHYSKAKLALGYCEMYVPIRS